MGRSEVSDLTVLFIVTKAMLVWVLFLQTKFNGQDPPSASEWPMSVCGVRLQTDLGCNSIKMALNIGGLQEVELSYLGWTGGTESVTLADFTSVGKQEAKQQSYLNSQGSLAHPKPATTKL